MKKTEEYLKLMHAKDFNPSSLGEAIKLVIKQVQIDAIKETCEMCSNEAETYEYNHLDACSECGHTATYVDKNSILSVADKLIKELEDGNKD